MLLARQRHVNGSEETDHSMDKTFVKGLSLLEALAASEGPRGITGLAQQLDLTKSNVHRLLQTLTVCGYVEQEDEGGRYQLTFKTWEVGHKVWMHSTIKRAASPFAQDLARRTGQLVHITVASGTDLLFLEQIGRPTPHPIRGIWPIGGRIGCWDFMAGGHDLIAIQIAYLAAMPSVQLRRAVKHLDGAPHSIVDPKDLDHRVSEARDRGYALNRGEWYEDVRGAAATFFHANGTPAGVLGLNAQADELAIQNLDRWGLLTKQSADAISHELGYQRGR
jgi:DNA-binding IclR family transcriptional regulator